MFCALSFALTSIGSVSALYICWDNASLMFGRLGESEDLERVKPVKLPNNFILGCTEIVCELCENIWWSSRNLTNTFPHPIGRQKKKDSCEKWLLLCGTCIVDANFFFPKEWKNSHVTGSGCLCQRLMLLEITTASDAL